MISWRVDRHLIVSICLLSHLASAIKLEFTLQADVGGSLTQKNQAPTEVIELDVDTTSLFGEDPDSQCIVIGEGNLGPDRMVRQLKLFLTNEEVNPVKYQKVPKAIALYAEEDCEPKEGASVPTRFIFPEVKATKISSYTVDFDKARFDIVEDFLDGIEEDAENSISDDSKEEDNQENDEDQDECENSDKGNCAIFRRAVVSSPERDALLLQLNAEFPRPDSPRPQPLDINSALAKSSSGGSEAVDSRFYDVITQYYDIRKSFKAFRLAWTDHTKTGPISYFYVSGMEGKIGYRSAPTLQAYYGEVFLANSDDEIETLGIDQAQED